MRSDQRPKGNDGMRLIRRGPFIRVDQRRPRPIEPAFHVATFLPQEQSRDSSRLNGETLVLERPQHPDITEELRLLLILQPVKGHHGGQDYLPGGAVGDLSIPWLVEPRTGLQLPARVVVDRTWERQWRVALLVTPSSVGVPGSAADMASTAWGVLGSADLELLVRLLAGLAFWLEVDGPFRRLPVEIVRDLALPPALQHRVLAEVRGGSPIFDPRALRWILQEVAAASVAGVWPAAAPPPLPGSGEDLLARLLFSGSLEAGSDPSIPELLRAIWLLHEGFMAELPAGTSRLDRALSISGSLGFGSRLPFAWIDRLNHWRGVWEVEDTHPAIAKNPAAQGQAHRPSDLRRILLDKTALTVGDLFTGYLGIASRFFSLAFDRRPHMMHREHLAATVSDRGHLSQDLMDTVDTFMVSSLAELGERLIAEMKAIGRQYAGLGSTPTYDTQTLSERPILRVRDDGPWAPLGLNLLADRTVDLPRAIAISDGRMGDSRKVGGIVGYMFEAAVTDRLERIGPRHHVLTEPQIAEATGRRFGADAIIGYSHSYLVVEASVQTLGAHIAQGSAQSVRRRCSEYHKKADQASETASLLRRITRYYDLPSPGQVATLVVTDVPLTLNPAVVGELRVQRPDRNPKFVCSLEEFDALLELGDVGWSIPASVLAWQAGPLAVPLEEQLHHMERLWGQPDDYWRFDLKAWLNAVPTEGERAA